MKRVGLDDDPRMEPVLRRFAGRLGHEVRFHRGRTSFKAEVKTQAPDLVALDLVLGRESSIAIIALRRGLGLRMVEEGVERGGQRRVLLESGAEASRGEGVGGGMDFQSLARACGELPGPAADPPS
jgi:hypothetical protein